MAKAGNLKLDVMAKSIGIHFFEFEDMFRCYRDNENLKKHFGHMDTLILHAQMAFLDLPSVISSSFIQNKGGGGSGLHGPLH